MTQTIEEFDVEKRTDKPPRIIHYVAMKNGVYGDWDFDKAWCGAHLHGRPYPTSGNVDCVVCLDLWEDYMIHQFSRA